MGWIILSCRTKELYGDKAQYYMRDLQISRELRRMHREYEFEQTLVENKQNAEISKVKSAVNKLTSEAKGKVEYLEKLKSAYSSIISNTTTEEQSEVLGEHKSQISIAELELGENENENGEMSDSQRAAFMESQYEFYTIGNGGNEVTPEEAEAAIVSAQTEIDSLNSEITGYKEYKEEQINEIKAMYDDEFEELEQESNDEELALQDEKTEIEALMESVSNELQVTKDGTSQEIQTTTIRLA